MNPIDKREPLLLLSSDARLAHLLAAEAGQLSLTLRVERTPAVLSSAALGALRLILWDMDSVPLPMDVSLPAECPICGISATGAPAPEHITLTARLTRPFSVDQLRTELLLPVSAAQPVGARESGAPLTLYFEDDALTLHIGNDTVALTEKEAAIMSLFLSHRGELVTKEQLRAVLATDAASVSESNTPEVHLSHLRSKLEKPFGIRLFHTVRGQGYQLQTSVTTERM